MLGTFSQKFASKVFVCGFEIMILRRTKIEEIVFEVELGFDRIQLVCKNFNFLAVAIILGCLAFFLSERFLL